VKRSRLHIPAGLSCSIAFLAAGSAPAQTQSFSHQLHLKLRLECTTCHAAATSSTRLEDNLLPTREICVKCHRTASVPAPAATRLSRFNHALHLKLGNAAPVIAAAINRKTYLSPPGDIRRHLNTSNPCVACHRGLDESVQVTRAALPRMADCLVCHNKVDPPFSCEFCHGKDASLKPVSHTSDWMDRHSSGKAQLDKSTCAVCHGRRFTCLGCH
jgi:hypothetical protein